MNCSKCGRELTSRYHILGNDYCADCARDVPRSDYKSAWDETVRGTIIGGDGVRYEFVCSDGTVKRGHFENDRQAIEWFKTTWPHLYAAGAEMRVFDI